MQEHLIIDGNNALFAIPDLAREMEIDRERARNPYCSFWNHWESWVMIC